MKSKLILGAPGCGKTTYLLNILEEELKTVAPNKIAFVSFTRKGAYEGKSRAIDKFKFKDEDFPFFRTLHSAAFATGGYTKYDVIQKKDYKTFSDAMNMHFIGYYTEEFYNNDDKYLFLEQLQRNNKAAAMSYLDDIDMTTFENVANNYTRFKAEKHIVDFTDMLEEFVKRNEPLPVEVAIIDEAQDLTTLQWQMCSIAFRNCKRIYIAGDDDQAIYEWSGADIGVFLNLKGERTILDKSYRLQRQVLKLAKNITGLITDRYEKVFDPVGSAGKVYFHNKLSDIEIDQSSWYFLSRNNFFLSWHKAFLQDMGVVYMEKDKKSMSEEIVTAINKYTANPHDTSVTPWLKEDAKIGDPWYDVFAYDDDLVAYIRRLIQNKADLKRRNITVSTIHGVKGGEADNVVVLMDITKAVRASLEQNMNSELRCLYVACTRAKKNLHIVHSNSKNGYDNFIDL